MFDCSDPAISYLKGIGYNVIRLPRASFPPLTLLSRQNDDLTVVGDLATIVQPGAALPKIKKDVQAANVNGNRSGNLKLDVGLTILQGLIEALGGNKVGIDAGYGNSSTIQFEFTDVTNDFVERNALDIFLSEANLKPGPTVGALLDADKVYAVVSILKSDKISVSAKDSNQASVKLDVPVIEKAVGANIAVSGGNDADKTVSYEGKSPVVFGFQAVQLIYDNGKYQSYRDLTNPAIGARALRLSSNEVFTDVEADQAGLLRLDGNFANLQ